MINDFNIFLNLKYCFIVTFVTMVQFIHKIIAFILALIVIFSSLSFTVEKHVCGGEIVDVSYIGNAESCGMENENDCDNNDFSHKNFSKKSCCDDISEYIQGNNIEQPAVKNLELDKVQFILAFTFSYISSFGDNIKFINFKDYYPPLFNRDIQVFYQTFLI